MLDNVEKEGVNIVPKCSLKLSCEEQVLVPRTVETKDKAPRDLETKEIDSSVQENSLMILQPANYVSSASNKQYPRRSSQDSG